jgi:hypothetical protein
MTNAQYDPRTASLEDLRNEKHLFNVWEGRKHLGSGAHWLTPEFIAHAATMYKHESKRGEGTYSDTPGDGKSPFNGGTGWGSDKPLDGAGAVKYARSIIKDRLQVQNLPDVVALAELIPCPEGFEKEILADTWMDDFMGTGYGNHDYTGNYAVILTKSNFRLIINMMPVTQLNDYNSEATSVSGGGHTNFKATKEGKEGWYTLSRRGVDDSFYCGDSTDWDALIEEEMKRAQESRERLEGMITVPGLKWSINPADKEMIADRIRSGGHSFVPAAMGVGMRLSTRRSSWCGRASKATEDYFGISPIYTESLDCD